MRCAIYYVPPPDDELYRLAATWLGRDCYGAPVAALDSPRLGANKHAALTAAPRRYGFHATMKAPFRLAQGRTLEQLQQGLGAVLGGVSPFALDLKITRLGDFYALVPVDTVSPLMDLAAEVTTKFDSFRAPLDDADLARRNMAELTERQRSHVIAWGYPYVFDQFRFHMTLTGPVPVEDRAQVEDALARYFGAGLHRLELSQLVIAVESADGAPFLVHSVHPLAAAKARLSA